VSALYEPGPQSGGRRPAPGRLALAQAFLNSHFDLEHEWGADLLATPDGLARWMRERGLRPGRVTGADVARVRAVREGLRALAAVHGGAPRDPAAAARLAEALGATGVSYTIDARGRVAPAPAGTGVASLLGLVLAAVHEAQETGGWKRLKICPGEDCGWAFYDHSRNRSSSWCSMQICGGRDKARAYRSRSREH
jgi:predicted RNA-binding Zn ribbon-like protein